MKTNSINDERVIIQYKFKGIDVIHVQMVTIDKFENLKKVDNVEYCKLML